MPIGFFGNVKIINLLDKIQGNNALILDKIQRNRLLMTRQD